MKKSRKKKMTRTRIIILLIIVALPLIYFGRRVYRYISAVHKERTVKKGILILRAENEVLIDRINQYERGTLLEAKARDDLGMIKPGEEIYLVPKE
ncbi:septum formation initiator family protein [candidate division WOR-3 bacterium]|nr:septum formation initiator family protein [candidate division WOR-3 bacterium]